MVPDVFLSYSRDDLVIARQFADALRAEGFDVWWDTDLKSGEAYDEVTEAALRGARAVIVLWSKKSVGSRWVRAEATLADRNRTLIPAMIEACERPIMFELTQTADLMHWRGDRGDQAWVAFANDTRRFIGITAPQPAPVAPTAGVPVQVKIASSRPSIAVMPFANLSGDPEQEYFADGMVAEVIEALSRFRNIFVIAHGSTRSFKGRDVSAPEAARLLGVRYVLEGNVRKAGDRVRIGVQLIDMQHGTSVWSQRFEDTLEDVFALQERVALAVAGKIEPTLNAAEFRRVANRPTEDMDSYDLYLRGHAISLSHTKDATLAALELLNRSILLDPDFGLALARAAHCHRLIYNYGWSADPEADRERCLELARRALQVAGDDAEVVTNVSYIVMVVEGDDKTALALIDRAIELNPGHARMFYWSGRMRLITGDTARAIEHLQQSMRLDPIGPMHNEQIFSIGLACFSQGRFEEALSHFRASGLYPKSSFSSAFMAACLAQLGRTDEAKVALERYHARSPQPIEELGRTWLHEPMQLELFLGGIKSAASGEPVAERTLAS